MVPKGFTQSPFGSWGYENLPESIYSLFKAFTAGRSWGELSDPLRHVHWVYVLLFVSFICITLFGVLNVVSAIFVESALESRQRSKDLLLQHNTRKKELYIQHLNEVFHTIDSDASGLISMTEMEHFLT